MKGCDCASYCRFVQMRDAYFGEVGSLFRSFWGKSIHDYTNQRGRKRMEIWKQESETGRPGVLLLSKHFTKKIECILIFS